MQISSTKLSSKNAFFTFNCNLDHYNWNTLERRIRIALNLAIGAKGFA